MGRRDESCNLSNRSDNGTSCYVGRLRGKRTDKPCCSYWNTRAFSPVRGVSFPSARGTCQVVPSFKCESLLLLQMTDHSLQHLTSLVGQNGEDELLVTVLTRFNKFFLKLVRSKTKTLFLQTKTLFSSFDKETINIFMMNEVMILYV